MSVEAYLKEVDLRQSSDQHALPFRQPQGDRVNWLGGDHLSELRDGELGGQLSLVQQSRGVN